MRGGLADRLFAARGDVELVAERQPLAQLELDDAAGIGRLVRFIGRNLAPVSWLPYSLLSLAEGTRVR
jgi:hypothetical protein